MANQTILLVEGKDDEHVLKHICDNRGIPRLDEVSSHEGNKDLLESLPTRLKFAREGDVIGVVIDADTDLDACWQAIRNRLINAKYQDVPAQPAPNGTVLDPPDGSPLPGVGVWIMPDNENPGKLEDFLRFLVPQQDELVTHATEVVETLPEKRFSDADEGKAVMHTWLAWQNSPGRPYGTAIEAGFLNASAPQADALASWLRRLFVEEAPTP